MVFKVLDCDLRQPGAEPVWMSTDATCHLVEAVNAFVDGRMGREHLAHSAGSPTLERLQRISDEQLADGRVYVHHVTRRANADLFKCACESHRRPCAHRSIVVGLELA